MKLLMILLLLLPALMAAPSTGQQSPLDIIIGQTNVIYLLVVGLMMAMIVLAAAVYVVGQLLGAETRAKATIWAQGMLVAVAISIGVILVLNAILPTFLTSGAAPLNNVTEMIPGLLNMAQMALVGIIIISLVLAAGIYVIGQMFGAETRARAVVWSTGLVVAAVFATILYVVIFQIIGPFANTFFAGTILGIYGEVVFEVVFLVAIFILITYILSKFFKVPEWEAYLNVEMSNLMTSFLIVLFVIGLFAVGTEFSLMISGGTQSSPPQVAISYMQATVADSALTASIDVYKINACTSMLSTFSRRIGEYVLSQTY